MSRSFRAQVGRISGVMIVKISNHQFQSSVSELGCSDVRPPKRQWSSSRRTEHIGVQDRAFRLAEQRASRSCYLLRAGTPAFFIVERSDSMANDSSTQFKISSQPLCPTCQFYSAGTRDESKTLGNVRTLHRSVLFQCMDSSTGNVFEFVQWIQSPSVILFNIQS